MASWFRRLWPDTLSRQLLVALVGGLLAAQAVTSTIWHDGRAHRAVEVPTRVLAERVSDLLILMQASDPPTAFVEHLQARGFRFSLSETAMQSGTGSDSKLALDMRALLEKLLAERLADPPVMHAFALEQHTVQDAAEPGRGTSFIQWLSPSALPDSRFMIEFQLAPTRWLQIDAWEKQGWRVTEPWQVFLDYFFRIYLLRIVLLVLVVLWAVRLVTRPILDLAQAAQALERDLDSPPMPVAGPVEVRRAAAAFNSMQSRLVAQMEERTRFLAAVSHDLRSPITRLRLRAEMLPESALKSRFHDDLEHMEAMVAATLDFLKSGEPAEQRRKVDLNSMLDSLRVDAAEVGADVRLHGRADCPIWGYPRSLKRCFDNVLDNALRYGHLAEIVVVNEPENVVVLIRDDGPGIAAQHMAHVTEPFYRVESSRNNSTGGYGLGLSIARAVVEIHAGQLTLHNRAEGGLEVRITLPTAIRG